MFHPEFIKTLDRETARAMLERVDDLRASLMTRVAETESSTEPLTEPSRTPHKSITRASASPPTRSLMYSRIPPGVPSGPDLDSLDRFIDRPDGPMAGGGSLFLGDLGLVISLPVKED